MRQALIHQVRLVGQQRGGPRSDQGEYDSLPLETPWIKARVMERGSVAPKTRLRPNTTEARVERGYEILLDFVDENGGDVAKPNASAVFESMCPVLGDPIITLSGEPEVLTNGRRLVGYMCFGSIPAERA